MLKLIYPEANEQLLAQCEGLMTKVIFNDSSNRLIKEASSNSITKDLLNEYKPDKDHFLIHFIGVGDYEKYGFNKNADAFPKLANEKYFNTFETNAHLFREHKSDNPDNAIGVIKKAVYNPEMGRIEVVAHCCIKKASEEYEKAKNGGYLSCSMGAYLKHDRDSITGKLSSSPSEYEPHMKNFPGQYIPEYKKYAFVYNDEPTFFDLSIVKRPAERIAHALEYKFASSQVNDNLLKKVANDGLKCIPSAILAEMEGIKYALNPNINNPEKVDILNKLIDAEKKFKIILFDSSSNSSPLTKFIHGPALNCYSKDDELSCEQIQDILNSGIRGETLFRELAKRSSILPFKSFINFIFPEDDCEKNEALELASSKILPNVFENLESFGIGLSQIENLFDSGSAMDCACDINNIDPVQKLMDSVEEKFSIEPEHRNKRLLKIVVINNNTMPEKNFSCILKKSHEYPKNIFDKAIKYSTAYALYKIAAINDIKKIKGKNFDDTDFYTLIGQNFIYNL